MTDREKIARIIAEHLCQQGKSHKTLYGAERMCYSRNNFADCEKVSECVDALIEAGIGNVSKHRTMDEVWQMLEREDGTKALSAGLLVGKLIALIVSERRKQGLSIAELARKIDVPATRVWRMENLKHMPRIDTVFQAALVLGIFDESKIWR